MSKKQIWIIGLLMIASAAIGALFVTNTGNVPFGIAGPDDVELGAKVAPVAATNEVQALNDAYVAVSKAITPQVVYITVTSEVKAASRPDDRFEDPFGFFQFPDRQMPAPWIWFRRNRYCRRLYPDEQSCCGGCFGGWYYC